MCYHTSHFLYHVCLIDGVASIIIFIVHGDARSCNFLMSGSIFILPPYAEREKKPSEYGDFCICRRREPNPGRQHSKQTRYPLHHCPSALQLTKIFYFCHFLFKSLVFSTLQHFSHHARSIAELVSFRRFLCYQVLHFYISLLMSQLG